MIPEAIASLRLAKLIAPCLGLTVITLLSTCARDAGASSSPTTGATAECVALIDRVRAMTIVVQRVDRAEAKRTRLADLQAATRDITFPQSSDPSRLICLVAVSGQLTASGQQSTTPARWGTFVFDASTGEPVASQVGATGDWPGYFDSVPAR